MDNLATGLSCLGVRAAYDATKWLVDQLAGMQLHPFDHPVVLAHHPALRRALTLGIARATGCAASMRFVSPTAWVDEVAGLEGVDGEWRATTMGWRLTASLLRQVDCLPPAAAKIV